VEFEDQKEHKDLDDGAAEGYGRTMMGATTGGQGCRGNQVNYGNLQLAGVTSLALPQPLRIRLCRPYLFFFLVYLFDCVSQIGIASVIKFYASA